MGPDGPESDSWYGIGIQPVYASGQWSFGGRVEWMGNKHGGRMLGVEDGSYLNITLTPGVTLGDHFLARLEYRIDVAVGGDNKDVLGKEDDPKSMQHSIGLGASYMF